LFIRVSLEAGGVEATLTASGYITLVPEIQDDWLAVFREPWILGAVRTHMVLAKWLRSRRIESMSHALNALVRDAESRREGSGNAKEK
jgi:hypothetical protein